MSGKRKFIAKRINQQELNDKTKNVLQECGTDNHVQALFYTNLSSIVNSTPKNKFVPLKCHIKDKSRESWAIAFQIVNSFLESNHMALTIEVMNTEDNKPLQYKSNFVARLHLSSRYPIIGELINSTEAYRRLSLKQKLAANDADVVKYTKDKRNK